MATFKSKWKVEEAQVLQMLGKKGVDDVTSDDLADMLGIHTALDEQLSTVEEIFGVLKKDEIGDGFGAAGGHTRTVLDALDKQRKARPAPMWPSQTGHLCASPPPDSTSSAKGMMARPPNSTSVPFQM